MKALRIRHKAGIYLAVVDGKDAAVWDHIRREWSYVASPKIVGHATTKQMSDDGFDMWAGRNFLLTTHKGVSF